MTRWTRLVIFVLVIAMINVWPSWPPAEAQTDGPKITPATSAHFNYWYRSETENLAINLPGEGDAAIDLRNRTLALQGYVRLFGDSYEVRLIDDTLYYKLGAGEVWESERLDTSFDPAIFEDLPAPVLNELKSLVTWTQVGPDTVDSTATTKWHGDFNMAKIVEFVQMALALSGSSSSASAVEKQLLEDLRRGGMTLEVWLTNDTQHLKRFRWAMEFAYHYPAGFSSRGDPPMIEVPIKLEYVVAYSKINQPVNIEKPDTRRRAQPTPTPARPRPTATATPSGYTQPSTTDAAAVENVDSLAPMQQLQQTKSLLKLVWSLRALGFQLAER